MSSQLTQSIIALAASYTVASVVGAATYLFIRYLERKYQPFKMIFGGWTLFFGILLVPIFALSPLAWLCFLGLLLAGHLHLESKGASSNRIEAFILMFGVCQWSFLVGAILRNFPTFRTLLDSVGYLNLPLKAGDIYYGICILSPLLTLIILRIFQTYHLRPGMDKHFES